MSNCEYCDGDGWIRVQRNAVETATITCPLCENTTPNHSELTHSEIAMLESLADGEPDFIPTTEIELKECERMCRLGYLARRIVDAQVIYRMHTEYREQYGSNK
jgi:hypothetical protein